jgi:putative transposase
VERNPLRAGLVDRAEAWPYSSLRWWGLTANWLELGPVPRPVDWPACVNAVQTEAELAAVHRSVRRGRPYGGADWEQATASRLGLESSLRPRGRPRKQAESKTEPLRAAGLFE